MALTPPLLTGPGGRAVRRPCGLAARRPCCQAAGQLGSRAAGRSAAVAFGGRYGRVATAEKYKINISAVAAAPGSARAACTWFRYLEAHDYSCGLLVLYKCA